MFKIGDRVISNRFGNGTVIDIKSEQFFNYIYPITVQFDYGFIEYFTEEGYCECDHKDEFKMIKLIKVDENIEKVDHGLSSNIGQTNSILDAIAKEQFKLVGRKFKIKYRDIDAYINKYDLRDIKVKTITGIIENFQPTAEVVIDGENGFCIIQYRQILQMEEIR